MKTQVYNVLIALSLTLAALTGCNNDNETTTSEETQFLSKIAGTWKLTDARVDGLLITSAFDDLGLTLDGNNYEVTNAVPPIWPNGGTYTLQQVQGAQPYALVRNDEVVITVAELTATTLVLKFQYTSANSGRLQSLSGLYEFRFTKS
jgi:hypothetical protein